MALDFDSGNGLFDRIGQLGRIVNLVNRWCGNASITLGSSEITTDVQAEILALQSLGASSGDPSAVQLYFGMGSNISQIISSSESFLSRLAETVQSAIILEVNKDTPLASLTIEAALAEIIRQMKAGGDYVSSPTISASVAAGTNDGNGTLVVSLASADGDDLDNIFAEDIKVSVTTTSTSGTPQLSAVGEAAVTNALSYAWPGGSGASKSITAVQSGSSYDKLTNGGFENFSPTDTPTGWTIDVGTVSTTILEEASTVFRGSKSLKIAGNGSQLTGISQTLTGLSSRTPYAFNMWGKMSSAPAAGVLQIDLYDGASVINDEAGNPNSFTVNLTTLGTTFVPINRTFRLPEPVPPTVKLRIHLTTALSNTKNLYLDNACLAASTELYNHGPWVCAFSGSSEWSLDDTFTITTATDRAGQFQEMFERLYSMRNKRLLLPTSGSHAIADTPLGL